MVLGGNFENLKVFCAWENSVVRTKMVLNEIIIKNILLVFRSVAVTVGKPLNEFTQLTTVEMAAITFTLILYLVVLSNARRYCVRYIHFPSNFTYAQLVEDPNIISKFWSVTSESSCSNIRELLVTKYDSSKPNIHY